MKITREVINLLDKERHVFFVDEYNVTHHMRCGDLHWFPRMSIPDVSFNVPHTAEELFFGREYFE